MKAISLWQPYASLVVLGPKKIETRSWKTDYRGRLAIHATKVMPAAAREFAVIERTLGRLPHRLPLGAIIGTVTLTRIRMTEELVSEISALERLYGDYSPGRWGWMLCDPMAFDNPIPYKGNQGFFEVPDELILECEGITSSSTRNMKVYGVGEMDEEEQIEDENKLLKLKSRIRKASQTGKGCYVTREEAQLLQIYNLLTVED